MGVYPGVDQFDESIHYLETDDPGEGGFNGVSNISRIQLANRTRYLKNRIDSHNSDTENPHEVSKAQIGLGNVIDELQLAASNNLSDLADKAAARSNLNIYSTGEVVSICDPKALRNFNLSDLTDKDQARTNLSTWSISEIEGYLIGLANKTHSHNDINILNWTLTYASRPGVKTYGIDIYFYEPGVLLSVGNGISVGSGDLTIYFYQTFTQIYSMTTSEDSTAGCIGVKELENSYFKINCMVSQDVPFRWIAVGLK